MADAISGVALDVKQGGTPTDVTDVGAWSLTGPRIENAKYASNSTAGAKKTTIGAYEWTATLTIFFTDADQANQNPFQLGLLYDLQLHVNKTGADYYAGQGRCVDHGEITLDAENGEPVSMDVVLEGHGIITGNGKVPALV